MGTIEILFMLKKGITPIDIKHARDLLDKQKEKELQILEIY